jgi:simple sugar transport system permease protein
MLVGGFNPILAYTALVQKVFGNMYNIGETIRQITPLIFTGLAVAFAFRTGLFNIGAEGQFIIGMVAATAVGISFELPAIIHAPLAVLAGGIAGGLWGSVAGYLKAKRGVNEVITSIMMNWVALYLANWVMNTFYVPKGQQRSEVIHESAMISLTWLSEMFDNARLHWGTLIAVVAAIFFYVIMWKTKTGYELRAVGFNPHASEYAGMNVSRNIFKAMFISGLFAGIGGASEILGVFHYQAILTAQPGYGFDGIAVALIGGNTPVGVVLAAILFGMLTFGGAGIQFSAGVPVELISVVIASVIFFVAAHGVVKIFLKPILQKKEGGK